MYIDGKRRILTGRRLCLNCSPFKLHNTRSYRSKPNLDNLTSRLCLICRNQLNNGQNSFCSLQCQKKYDFKRHLIRKNKNKHISIEYLGGKCIKCGKIGNPIIFEFHHRDPNIKDTNICDLLGRNWNNIKNELDKCDLLCRNCHFELHYQLNIRPDNYQNRHIEKYRKLAIEYLGGKCIICGYDHYGGGLCFHHKDSTEKKFNLSCYYNYKWNTIQSELDKCVLLCENCHQLVHHDSTIKQKLEDFLRINN